MQNKVTSDSAQFSRHSIAFIQNMRDEIARVIVGQQEVVDSTIIALLCDGHLLLEGVPGLAKTLLCNSVAQCIDAQFQRIQFTPDLLPSDLIGSLAYRPDTASFYVKKGPIFANLILADEINRAPAKVQSALLEAMQEQQVTIGDTSHPLPRPFLVMATQNPIEQEGTYPLPEAQVDRFMMKVVLDYPNKEEERAILDRMTQKEKVAARCITNLTALSATRKMMEECYIDERIKDYIVKLVCATRNHAGLEIRELQEYLEFGASPRATIWLTKTSTANAFIDGRNYVTPEDVQAVAHRVLRHRLTLNFDARAQSVTADALIDILLDHTEVP